MKKASVFERLKLAIYADLVAQDKYVREAWRFSQSASFKFFWDGEYHKEEKLVLFELVKKGYQEKILNALVQTYKNNADRKHEKVMLGGFIDKIISGGDFKKKEYQVFIQAYKSNQVKAREELSQINNPENSLKLSDKALLDKLSSASFENTIASRWLDEIKNNNEEWERLQNIVDTSIRSNQINIGLLYCFLKSIHVYISKPKFLWVKVKLWEKFLKIEDKASAVEILAELLKRDAEFLSSRLLLDLADNYLDAAVSTVPAMNSDGVDALTVSINHAYGKLTIAICNGLWKQDHNQCDESSSLKSIYFSVLERLILGSKGLDNPSAAVILSTQSSFFYRSYPGWTKEFILPLFDFDSKIGKKIWEGFLHQFSLYPSWIELLLPKIILQINSDGLPKLNDRLYLRFYDVLAIACLDFPELYAEGSMSQCLMKIKDQGRSQFLKIFNKKLRQSNEKTKYWKESLFPILESYWPRDRMYQSNDTVTEYVKLIIQLDSKSIRSDLDFMLQEIEGDNDLSEPAYAIDRSGFDKEHPIMTAKILNIITPESSREVEVLRLVEAMIDRSDGISADSDFQSLCRKIGRPI